jgi:RNA polymerase sigma factor (sigma-70 family)
MHDGGDDRDEALVVAIAARDDAAFVMLYRRYLPVVLRWCLRESGNREIAADLSAEVFAAALISARRYQPQQGSVLAWLLGIARNKLLESRRRKRVEDSARRKLRLEPVALTASVGLGTVARRDEGPASGTSALCRSVAACHDFERSPHRGIKGLHFK